MTSYNDAFSQMRSNKFAVWAPKNEQSMEDHFAAARIHEGYAAVKGPSDLALAKNSSFFVLVHALLGK